METCCKLGVFEVTTSRPGERVRQALERVGRLEPPRRTRSSRAASPRPGKPAGVHQLRPMGEHGGRQELACPRRLPGTGGTTQRGTRQLRATNARDRRTALDTAGRATKSRCNPIATAKHRNVGRQVTPRTLSPFRQNATTTHLYTTPAELGRHRTSVRYRNTKVPMLRGDSVGRADGDVG